MRQSSNAIGLFPLRLFLLPGEQTTLHIYEPRYLQLVTECISEYKLFGIPYQTKTSLSEYGSLVTVVEILKTYDNGELDILVECVQNFKIKNFEAKDEIKLYPSGAIHTVDRLDFNPSGDLMHTMKSFLEALMKEGIAEVLENCYAITYLTKLLNLDDAEKFRLLKYTDEQRNTFLGRKARFLTILLEQEKKVVDQFYLN
jgi:Lon protease-like protein